MVQENTAQRCPVCNGAGVLSNREYPGNVTALAPPTIPCHGCEGRGWVIVAQPPTDEWEASGTQPRCFGP
jgi:DnaJ-class molecular chaperone